MEETWEESSAFSSMNIAPNEPSTFGRGRGIARAKPQRDGGRPFDNNGNRERFGKPPRDGGRPFNGDNDNFGSQKADNKNMDDADTDGVVKKPPVTYIPPDPTDDEKEMYGSGLNTGINFDQYEKIDIIVTKQDGDDMRIPQQLNSFASSGLRPFLIDVVAKCGYKKPTPVQRAAIPIIMEGRDLMACAQTGSGKTAAFLLPIINTLLTECDSEMFGTKCCPQVIILSPTRELAIQIFEECRKFTRSSRLKCAICYGGTGVNHQISRLTSDVNIIVATVGRLQDFLNRGRFDLSSLKFLVLDEADRMLDMGFKPKIEEIMTHETISSDRQTLMFSATFPSDVQRLARDFLKHNYLFAAVGKVGGACSDVEQCFIEVTGPSKREKLLEIVQERSTEKTLIFVETKRYADMLTVILCERDLPATSIHGDREQQQREEALLDFRRGTRNILVATNVASRGLDVKGVEHVINYDMPKDVDEYVHRIGRTGRLGNRGRSTTFYDPSKDAALVPQFIDILKCAGQPIPEFFQDFSDGNGYDGGNFGGIDTRHDAVPANAIENEEW